MNLTDDDMRVKCAEAMGWKWHGDKHWDQEPKAYYWRLGNMAYQQLPNYPASVEAALSICDRLRDQGWVISMDNDLDGKWDVVLTDINKGNHPANMVAVTGDPSLARAVCLAFLRVKGLDSVARSL